MLPQPFPAPASHAAFLPEYFKPAGEEIIQKIDCAGISNTKHEFSSIWMPWRNPLGSFLRNQSRTRPRAERKAELALELIALSRRAAATMTEDSRISGDGRTKRGDVVTAEKIAETRRFSWLCCSSSQLRH
jgi:hypothetical protein